jgi:hypothetical protein
MGKEAQIGEPQQRVPLRVGTISLFLATIWFLSASLFRNAAQPES